MQPHSLEEIKERDRLYKPSAKKVEIVDVPAMNFLMVDGAGDPNASQDYQEAIEALYSWLIRSSLP
jgi:hypothetical protein